MNTPKLNLSRRNIFIGTIASLSLLIIIYALLPSPIYVDVSKIKKGDFVVTIDDEGKTQLKDVYTVSAPVAGRVRRIGIEAGDPVIANTTVLALFQPNDPVMLDVRSRTEAEASVKSAKAAVELAEAEQLRAEAQLEFSEIELNRGIPLAKQGTISKATLDQRELTVKTALAQLSQASASLNKTRADLEFAKARLIKVNQLDESQLDQELIPVKSPVSGLVIRVIQESEGVVSAGTPLLELGDPKKLEIITDLISSDAVKINKNHKVIIEDWGGKNELYGKVRLVEPFGFTKFSALGIEEQRVNVLIDFTSNQEEWSGLGHGYKVDTKIVIYEKPNALMVPISAMFRVDDEWAVFVKNRNKAKLKKIKIGNKNSLNAEVISGLNEGEQVILHPSNKVEDNIFIKTRQNL